MSWSYYVISLLHWRSILGERTTSGSAKFGFPISLFWSLDLKSYYVISFLTDDPSLVTEPPSLVWNSVSYQIFITNYHSNKPKVRLLLANINVWLNKFSYRFPVRPYGFIYLFKETWFYLWLYAQICSAQAQTGSQVKRLFTLGTIHK